MIGFTVVLLGDVFLKPELLIEARFAILEKRFHIEPGIPLKRHLFGHPHKGDPQTLLLKVRMHGQDPYGEEPLRTTLVRISVFEYHGGPQSFPALDHEAPPFLDGRTDVFL
jgi:hypothetical protein